MSTDQNAEQLDWRTYKALAQVVKDRRLELIAEREDPSCEEHRKYALLVEQMACTEIGARMLQVMQDDMDSRLNKKES